ncbi:twin-arginine translocase TatA/TatE family subunit [Thermophilibacter immobilis]|jgi:sec-independent protein translocase protein TatA|uniref:Sec-independent protein translocase protein TatA n=1 Tax=Thermophilibacter immobilis TaxID=2779519 RepID=A0A7S7M7N6_9ACTN|nr:twin-arginine translocase TatA/TatE family subunit [Thermophilibacter immobilis]QOY60148.1 twin-arginine translocase TatA/TatE family subunit [Thermophilibacter immobilis]
MILGMGVPELAIILLVVLVVFGPKNLPKLGATIGKTVKNVREGMEDGEPAPAEAAASADVSQAVSGQEADVSQAVSDHEGDAE